MAKRIRTLKPEILEDEEIASLPHLEWRLFVSLIVMADDYGNLRAVSALVKGVALWASPESVEQVQAAIDKLIGMKKLRRYVVRGQTYLHIAGWSKHQAIDRPGKPIVPRETEAEPEVCAPREPLANHSREKHEPFVRGLDLDLDQEGKGPGAIPVAPVREPEPGMPISVCVALAYRVLNEARKRIDPKCRDLPPMSERPLVDRLKATPPEQREADLRHCMAVLIAKAERSGSVNDLHMGYLGGPNAWPSLLAGSVTSSKGRDGPAGKPKSPAIPRTLTHRKPDDEPDES